MEPSFVAQVLVMWMMLSMVMTNSVKGKSMAWDMLKLERETSIRACFLPLLFALFSRKKHNPPQLFWVEHRQATHWNYVEMVVWRSSDEMHHKKFKRFYRMSYGTFENLVNMPTPFLKSRCVNQVRPQMEIKKIVACVFYRFAHGHSPKHMADHFKIGASTIRKYLDIVCGILTNKDKLFSQCISTPTKEHLLSIISDFEDIIGLPSICGAIDGTHILLAKNPSRRVTLAASDFYNRKKFHSIVLQAVCDSKKIFWNVCASQLEGVHHSRQFKMSNLYRSLKKWEIL